MYNNVNRKEVHKKMRTDDLKLKTGRKKTKMIAVRLLPEDYQWIKTKQYSPTKIFNQALKELKNKEEVRE